MSVPRRFHGHGFPSHVTTRTANQRRVFADIEAAAALLRVIREVTYETRSRVYAWVIMPDHVHIVLASPALLSSGKVLGRIKGRFARRWNRACGTSGAVWQGRSHERVVRSERALEATVGYVQMNPVKAGLSERMEDYRWSSAYVAPSAGTEFQPAGSRRSG
jgi:putative transposase